MAEIVSGLFADDVRFEDNGKMFIVGLYSADMTVQTFPWQQALRPIIVVKDPADLSRIFITISAASGAFSIGAEAELQLLTDASPPFQTVIPLPAFPLRLEAPDEIQLAYAFQEGQEHVVAGKLRIIQAGAEAAPSVEQSRP